MLIYLNFVRYPWKPGECHSILKARKIFSLCLIPPKVLTLFVLIASICYAYFYNIIFRVCFIKSMFTNWSQDQLTSLGNIFLSPILLSIPHLIPPLSMPLPSLCFLFFLIASHVITASIRHKPQAGYLEYSYVPQCLTWQSFDCVSFHWD